MNLYSAFNYTPFISTVLRYRSYGNTQYQQQQHWH